MTIQRTFEQKVDLPAVLGQFLANAKTEDLVIELVQNEIDGGASKTVITFGADALTAEGDGANIEADGWDRLAMVLGAGGEVAAKHDGIGAKNHGLRTGFRVGDDISVASGGERMDLTLCKSPSKRKLDPGSWSRIADPAAPTRGVRVTIPYRRRPLEVPSGESFTLPPLLETTLRKMFEDAVTEAPSRFISAISAQRARYVLEFRWKNDEVRTLMFDRVPARFRDWPGLVRRQCQALTSDGASQVLLREAMVTFPVRLGRGDHAKVPRFYRSGTQILGELSWALDEDGAPVASAGMLRYPIGYPAGAADAYSGHGFHISAPFVSDTTRHGLASAAERNSRLLTQARAAMVDVFKRQLLPRYGASVLDIVRRRDRDDPAAEFALITQLLDADTLLVRSKSKSSEIGSVGLVRSKAPITLARYIDEPRQIAKALFGSAPPLVQLLDEATPGFVVEILAAMDTPRIRRWNDHDAIAQLIPADEDTRAARMVARTTAAEVGQALRCLTLAQRALDRETLDPAFIQRLRSEAVLPTAQGVQAPWSKVYFSRSAPPDINGVETPAIIHPKLIGQRLLREGKLKLLKFQLDDYLGRLDFTGAGKMARAQFFRWLGRHHTTVEPSTLERLAEQSFWPADDGTDIPLARFVSPKSALLKAMLAGVVPFPSAALLAFDGLRRSGRGALYLRTWPNSDELHAWYRHGARAIDVAEAQGDIPAAHEELAKLELGLCHLLDEPKLAEFVPVIANQHRTLNRVGQRGPIEHLHLDTVAVAACRLTPEDLIGGPHHHLYLRLNARVRPASAAVLRALVTDVLDGETLYRRLEAYALEADLETLREALIIPIGGKVLAPSTLYLHQPQNLWGDWKQLWSPADLTADRSTLLVSVGVARVLTETLSADFFAWLSKRSTAVQARHLPQILRHLRDKQRGPLKWWSGRPNLPCLPTRGSDDVFELVAFSRATQPRGPVYLPDFPEVQDALLRLDRSKRLVITDMEGVAGTLFAPLREVKVKSLRAAFGRPVELSAVGEAQSGGAALEKTLADLRSERMLEELPKRLELHGLSQDQLRTNWRTHLRNLTGVRIARGLTAAFAFNGRRYEVGYSAGVDPTSGLVWMDASRSPSVQLFEALGRYLFLEEADPLAGYGLMLAVEQPFASAAQAPQGVDLVDESSEPAIPAPGPAPERLERGHGLSQSDQVPIVPHPQPFSRLPIQPTPKISGGRRPSRPKPAASTEPLRGSVQELEQILQLKEGHYGWHCQACLGVGEVQTLTPANTYLALAKYRKPLLHAHHVDHLQNSGGLGAANLVALCHYHHDLLGDRLTRTMVCEALEQAEPATRSFARGEGEPAYLLVGMCATFVLDKAPFTAKLFFTPDHAALWSKPAAHQAKDSQARSGW